MASTPTDPPARPGSPPESRASAIPKARKERKTMQEVRDEMARRVASIERRNEWLDEQCGECRTQLTDLTRELEQNKTLANQYRQLIDSIPVVGPPDRAVRA